MPIAYGKTEQQIKALEKLRRKAAERVALEAEIAALVGVARQSLIPVGGYYECRATWAEVGEALGVTQQAAQKRYG